MQSGTVQLGKVGVFSFPLVALPFPVVRDLVAQLEAQGWSAVWMPETMSGDPLVRAGQILSATERMAVATGIASIWLRSPLAMSNASRQLAQDHPGRFLLGLGVSHGPVVEGVLGEKWERPLQRMRDYLDTLDAAPSLLPSSSGRPPRVLAALREGMLRLAAERADGAHPYLVPPDHTRRAREILGEGPLLCVEQKVVLETDPDKARTTARRTLAMYLGLPNYAKNLRWLGFTEEDLASGGSDRLVDALVVWGDEEDVLRRVREHFDAGADHVCVQVLTSNPIDPGVDVLARLAPVLTAA
ncbi:MAG: LLM class F420-dependent oxidoreductase [Acidimicrobiales bacterium]|nr:MAG: LLM class F420-dependent oxidoreductase [Acidimicrobiales bacterium]